MPKNTQSALHWCHFLSACCPDKCWLPQRSFLTHNIIKDFIFCDSSLIRDGWSYYCCDSALYSDSACSGNTFENNIIYGSGSSATTFNCGLDNESKNNYIHRVGHTDNGVHALDQLWNGCSSKGIDSFNIHHNIHYFDNTEGFILYSPFAIFDSDNVFSDNLYFSEDPSDEFKGMFPPDDVTFADLPSVGSFRNKWEDPLFSSAAAHNYLLAENSPAL